MHKLYANLKGFAVFEMHGYSNIEDFYGAATLEKYYNIDFYGKACINYGFIDGDGRGPKFCFIDGSLLDNSFIAEEANA